MVLPFSLWLLPPPSPPFFCVCMAFPFVRFVCPMLMTACCVAAGDSVILAVGPVQLFAYPRKWDKEGNANARVYVRPHMLTRPSVRQSLLKALLRQHVLCVPCEGIALLLKLSLSWSMVAKGWRLRRQEKLAFTVFSCRT